MSQLLLAQIVYGLSQIASFYGIIIYAICAYDYFLNCVNNNDTFETLYMNETIYLYIINIIDIYHMRIHFTSAFG